MRLSQFSKTLSQLEKIAFQLPNGSLVPAHFHVTEIGQIDKKFIDCGGMLREEQKIPFQLWEENDYNHRLHPEKLVKIITLAKEKLQLEDHKIEVEYQGESINKYNLEFDGENFLLQNTKTDCLAKDSCGVPADKPKRNLSEIQNHCSPETGCC